MYSPNTHDENIKLNKNFAEGFLCGDPETIKQIEKKGITIARSKMGGLASVTAEDIVQIAFMKMWERRNKVDFGDGGIMAYFKTTIINTIKDMRKSKANSTESFSDIPDYIPNPGNDVPNIQLDALRYDAKDQITSIGIKLTASAGEKQQMQRMQAEGYSIDEIARAMGKSYAATQRAIFRMKNKKLIPQSA
jgi:RNA polymerase sigma factor (sigma-70 family)